MGQPIGHIFKGQESFGSLTKLSRTVLTLIFSIKELNVMQENLQHIFHTQDIIPIVIYIC